MPHRHRTRTRARGTCPVTYAACFQRPTLQVPTSASPSQKPDSVASGLYIWYEKSFVTIKMTYYQQQTIERRAVGSSKLCLSGQIVKCTPPRLSQGPISSRTDVKQQTSLSRNSSIAPSFQRISLAWVISGASRSLLRSLETCKIRCCRTERWIILHSST
jgi:hypothetical protein